MRSTRLFLALIAAIVLIHAIAANAASVDMNDPKRAVGLQDDVRIDAQLLSDQVAPGGVIAVTYQIQNLTSEPLAIADKEADATYDSDTQTIILAIGSEVPLGGKMPHMVVIMPGETKTLSASAIPILRVASVSSPNIAAPRYVQVKVSLLRDVAASTLIQKRAHASQPLVMPDALFDKWLQGNDSIFLNAIPVRYSPRGRSHLDVENGAASAHRGRY